MPTGLYDIHDKAEVLHPQEIAAGKAQCVADNLDYITDLITGRAIPLAAFVERLEKRFKRAVATGQMIDAMRSGYCTIEPNGSPPPSKATH